MSKRKHGKNQYKGVTITSNQDEISSLLNAVVLPLTDQLINELILKGFTREDLEQIKSMGCGYCPERDSFLSLEWHSGMLPD